MEHTKTAICPNCLTPSNLKAINKELLKALEQALKAFHSGGDITRIRAEHKARTAIKAAKGDA